jgi:hypothetical protein
MEPNPFRDLIAMVQACSIITMAYLKKEDPVLYKKYAEDNLPHPLLPFIIETKEWIHDEDDEQNEDDKKSSKENNDLKISKHVQIAYNKFTAPMVMYKSTKDCIFQGLKFYAWGEVRRRIKLYVELYQCAIENSVVSCEEDCNMINKILGMQYEQISSTLHDRATKKKVPSVFKTGKAMLLSLKERVKTIDRETNACQDDAVQLAAYKKDISAFDEGNTSRKRSVRIINKGDNTSSPKNRAVSNDTKKDDFQKEEMNQGDVLPKPYYIMNNSVVSSEKKNSKNLQEEGKER